MTEQANAQRLAGIRRATNQLLSMRGQWGSIAHHMEADGEFRNATTPENVLFLLQQLEARDREIKTLTDDAKDAGHLYTNMIEWQETADRAATRWEALKAWLAADVRNPDRGAAMLTFDVIAEMARLEREA